VTALVRDKARAGALPGAASIVAGDARDESVLLKALVGCDAVVSAIGTKMSPFKDVTILSAATSALVKAMANQGVNRLICMTGLGAGDSRGHGGFLFDRLVLPLLLKRVYQDKDRQEAIIRQSQLDWTLVRPMILTNKPPSGKVQATVDLAGVHGGSISRADVARFIVGELSANRWVRQSPLLRSAST
jgi:putative NADH-flavin reductase